MIIKNYLRDPLKYGILSLSLRGYLRWLPDKTYLKWNYWANLKKRLNLKNPKTFNEKLQWLKLYAFQPAYTQMVDKYAVRKIIEETIGQEYLVPLVGGPWDCVDEVDFDALPDQFVLKVTHDSGGLVICRDKSKLDIEAAKAKLKRGMNRDYYLQSREKPYKDVPHRIIAEKYMQDGDRTVLPVYKIFNFNGKPELIQSIQNDKTKDESIDYFDTQWNRLDLRQNFPNSKQPLPKPQQLNEMLELAAAVSKDIPFLRTDWYTINGKVYFSEFTFYSDAGMAAFEPASWDDRLGALIRLPIDK